MTQLNELLKEQFQTYAKVKTTVIIQNKSNNKFLLMQRAGGDEQGGLWECPGGGVDNHMEVFQQEGVDLLEFLIEEATREVQEEAGINVSNLQFLGEKSFVHFDTKEIFGNYYFLSYFEEGQIINLSHEHDDYIWIDASEVNNYEMFLQSRETILELEALSKKEVGIIA
jgi:8-oxo-dGTP pyrophosphatase MutT (NUDIX family)